MHFQVKFVSLKGTITFLFHRGNKIPYSCLFLSLFQGFHCVCWWHLHWQRESSMALLLPLWSERNPGEMIDITYNACLLYCIIITVIWPLTLCMQEHLSLSSLAGMCCMVDGTIPASSGLSSSSAMVCCAGLVTMEANQKSLSKVVLTVNPLTCITYNCCLS